MHKRVPKNYREVLSLISEVSRAVRCCQQEEVFCENVTFSQFFILDAVARDGSLELSELHKILSVDKSTTTRLVDPLVKQGLVVREKSSRDSRAVNLKLTKQGESVCQKVWACLSGFIDAVEKGIPEKRRGEVYDAVRTFLNATRNACAAKCNV
jgi:DNA-binding MarR family transcriptional regulator